MTFVLTTGPSPRSRYAVRTRGRNGAGGRLFAVYLHHGFDKPLQPFDRRGLHCDSPAGGATQGITQVAQGSLGLRQE